ncbi:UNVERIFIED_ORG: putative Co/Zn/Cd cation transporter (cation efflux family) [Pseudomonas parafulva]|jgi:predicted Co/Zn/Cd cation transporter (cation efflux family)|uniref:Cation transporter n=1 Tax=Pseudomonas fulva TaxID=47880 RepID=A0A2V4JIY7_9PSED|nr:MULTISPECIES: cation transporter [Pseudomonas]MDP9557601.1 putative Co/Zn/Cd cation transporter (cation efflux family) [Pseudomonas parafulva]HCP28209.1 cation transporter [Pseudomonas sp.]MBF8776539.1 cation transporter [Pseudomonas fulva]MDH0620585.1 cation transporter [Pseudomonas fulva]MDI3375853.1 cation transporter [Pseudomonas sp. V104_6]
MHSSTPPGFFDITSEQGLLRTSIAVTLFIASIGIAFGLASGSFSIVFDGVYSLVDASMSGLSLMVVRLITSHASSLQMSRKLRERFTMGFWHLEPMVLALNGILLSGVAIYALINAVSSLLEGGRHLEFGIAMVYAALTVTACVSIAVIEGKANRKLRSDFVAMDVKGWVMSASITAALLIAFCFGYAVQGTSLEWVSPYIDPAVLALVCLVIVPLPMSVVRQALADIFLVTPGDLKQHVDAVAQAFVERHGLQSYRAYVAKVGRSREIELYFIVPPQMAAKTIEQWDAWRNEIGEAIGGEGPNRWLTVVFTGDPEWAE